MTENLRWAVRIIFFIPCILCLPGIHFAALFGSVDFFFSDIGTYRRLVLGVEPCDGCGRLGELEYHETLKGDFCEECRIWSEVFSLPFRVTCPGCGEWAWSNMGGFRECPDCSVLPFDYEEE